MNVDLPFDDTGNTTRNTTTGLTINQMFNLSKNTLMEFKGLTELEFDFIYELSASDFTFECGKEDGIGGYVSSNEMPYYDHSGEGFDMKRVRGVMSSLIQKGYIRVDDASFVEFGSSSVTKDTWVVVTDMEITEAIWDLWNFHLSKTEVV